MSTPTNNELKILMNSLKESTDTYHKNVDLWLERIENQTKRHNGRLTRLERTAWTTGGAIAIFGLIEFDKIINLFQ